jgi:hypothetical protein
MICCLMLYLHLNAPALANLPGSSVAAAAAAADAGYDTGINDGLSALPYNSSAVSGGDGSRHSSGASSSSSGVHTTKAAAAATAAGSAGGWHPWHAVEPLLLLLRLPQPPQNVLDLYAVRRTHDLNGVSIPSQRRWENCIMSASLHRDRIPSTECISFKSCLYVAVSM